jgi:glycosyltransferase involved in cell wall biosynthesis
MTEMKNILHIAPVVPVDEHHIEYALDRMGVPGSLITSWLPTALESGLLRSIPSLRRNIRREPVRLHVRSVARRVTPDLRRTFELMTRATDSTLVAHDRFFDSIDAEGAARIDSDTSAVIAREFGAWRSFTKAQATGTKRVYHLPTTHHQRLQTLLQREQEEYPDTCRSTFDPWEFEPTRIQRKSEEIAMADQIICPSQFVKDTLVEAGVPEKKIAVIPFGSESSWLDMKRLPSKKMFLFVGNISARKGAHRLIKAWNELGAWKTHELLLVGDMHLSPSFLKEHAGTFRHLPKVSRDELRDLYRQADALVLPALAEGFALVILEALSCGTPVLASYNSGAAGFLKADEEAKLFPAQDDNALKKALEWSLSQPSDLAEMGRIGRQRAASWQWLQFQNRLIELLHEVRADK